MNETTTQRPQEAQVPSVSLEAWRVLLDIKNMRYWQAMEEAKRRRQQLIDDTRDAVEDERRTP